MQYECDHCGETFWDDADVSGDSCNRCEEGIVQRCDISVEDWLDERQQEDMIVPQQR